jgi:S-ribosylhomocysteine lyase
MIPSFQVNHTKLNPGLYVSRIDKLGNEEITTFDIRVCKPNKDMMTPAIAHTIEHLMADYLRNDSPLRDTVLYFGPMGCLTGFYLILKGRWSSELIKSEIADAFYICSKARHIPGATEVECGNYRLNDLKSATELCKRYSIYLKGVGSDCLHYSE